MFPEKDQKDIINVLLIDDNPGDAKIVETLLNKSSNAHIEFNLFKMDRLEAGLEFVLTHKEINAILLDLHLPDSSGIETLTKVYSVVKDIPIIVLTGTAIEEGTGIRAIREGAQDYLVKDQLNSTLLSNMIRFSIERKCPKKIHYID